MPAVAGGTPSVRRSWRLVAPSSTRPLISLSLEDEAARGRKEIFVATHEPRLHICFIDEPRASASSSCCTATALSMASAAAPSMPTSFPPSSRRTSSRGLWSRTTDHTFRRPGSRSGRTGGASSWLAPLQLELARPRGGLAFIEPIRVHVVPRAAVARVPGQGSVTGRLGIATCHPLEPPSINHPSRQETAVGQRIDGDGEGPVVLQSPPDLGGLPRAPNATFDLDVTHETLSQIGQQAAPQERTRWDAPNRPLELSCSLAISLTPEQRVGPGSMELDRASAIGDSSSASSVTRRPRQAYPPIRAPR